MILDLLLDRLNALTGRKPYIARDFFPHVDRDVLLARGIENMRPSCTRCRYYAGAGAESALKCAVNPKGEASTCPDYELK